MTTTTPNVAELTNTVADLRRRYGEALLDNDAAAVKLRKELAEASNRLDDAVLAADVRARRSKEQEGHATRNALREADDLVNRLLGQKRAQAGAVDDTVYSLAEQLAAINATNEALMAAIAMRNSLRRRVGLREQDFAVEFSNADRKLWPSIGYRLRHFAGVKSAGFLSPEDARWQQYHRDRIEPSLPEQGEG